MNKRAIFIILSITVCISVLFSRPVVPQDRPDDSGDQREENQREENSESSGGKNVNELIDLLGAQYLSERKKARNALIELGSAAVPELMDAARSNDFRTRKGSIIALGKIGDRRALPLLVDGFLSDEPNIKQACRSAIIEFGTRSFKHLEKYISEHPQSGKKIQQLLEQIVRRRIETVFYGEISEDGGVGYYDGQFRELKPLGRRVIPILKKIAKGNYDFEEVPPSPPEQIGQLLRGTEYFSTMAINAIGRLGSEKDISFLESLSPEVPIADTKSTVVASALARLGQPERLEQLKERIRSSYREAVKENQHIRILSSGNEYASLLSRTGDNEKAIDVYERLLDIRERGIWWYNLACSYAQTGKKDKAIEALKNAHRQGYRDEGWLKIDGDMDPLRDMPEFQNIMEKMEKETRLKAKELFDRNGEDKEDGEEGNDQKDSGQEKKKSDK